MAIGGKSRHVENGSITRKPLPWVATGCCGDAMERHSACECAALLHLVRRGRLPGVVEDFSFEDKRAVGRSVNGRREGAEMIENEQGRLRSCRSSAARAGEPSAEPVQCAEQGSLQPDWDAGQEEFGLVRLRGRHPQRVAAAFGVYVPGPVQGEAAFDELLVV